jgi:Flp pilus assembly protein TadD
MGVIDESRFISMEYVDGQTLGDVIHSIGRLSPRQTVVLARQICSALRAIHQHAIVHRDLKPSNIMLDRSGRAVVMDFGLALHHGADKITSEGEILGTLAYLSPEQAHTQTLDGRSDIYALGLIIFEMLTGKRAPGDDGRFPLALRKRDDRVAPSQLTPEVPPALDAIVHRCLEPKPEKRYPNVNALDHELSKVEAAPSETGRAERVKPTPTLRSWKLVSAGLAIMVATIVAVIFFKPSPQINEVTPPSVAFLSLEYEGPRPSAYLRQLVPLLLGDEIRGNTAIGVAPFSASRTFEPGEDTRLITRQLDVTHLLKGRLEVDERRMIIAFRILGKDGDQMGAWSWTGEPDTVLDHIDEMTEEIVSIMDDSVHIPPPVQRPYGRAAMAAYIEGRTYLEGWDVERSYLEAEDAFRRAIDEEERFAEAYAGLAQALWTRYLETRDTDLATEALSAAEKAVSLDETLPEAHLALGIVLLGQGRSAEAAAELEQAQKLAPGNDVVCRSIASAYDALGRNDAAVEMYQRAIDLRPGFWENHNSKGIFHMRQGELPLAKELFRQVIDLRPESDTGYNNLASTHILAGELYEAEPLLQAALRIHPNPAAHDNLGFVFYSTGRFQEAAREFRKAIDAGNDDAMSWGNLGDAYRQMERTESARKAYDKALERAEEVLRINPNDLETRMSRAMVLAGLGRCLEAGPQAEQCLSAQPDRADLHYYAALVFAVCGEQETAVHHTVLAIEGGVVADMHTNPDLSEFLDEPAIRQALQK